MQNSKANLVRNANSNKAYARYCAMLYRCYNPKHEAYKNYGGRGITVCDEWLNKDNGFENYARWCHENEPKDTTVPHSLDRTNNDLGYSPNNCKFKNLTSQSINKRKQANNTSGYVGVSAYNGGKKFRYYIQFKYSTEFKAGFNTIEDALIARNARIVEDNLEHKIQALKYSNVMVSNNNRIIYKNAKGQIMETQAMYPKGLIGLTCKNMNALCSKRSKI